MIEEYELNLGEIFETDYLKEDESISEEFERLKTIIESILFKNGIIAVEFKADKNRAEYLKGKWIVLQATNEKRKDNSFPCENYFLRVSRDKTLSYEKLEKIGIDPLYNYDLYSYTTTIIIAPESESLSIEDYLFILAFRIRQLHRARITDFLEYQNDKYWDETFLNKLRYLADENENLVHAEKLMIIEKWIEDQSNSNTSMASEEPRTKPILTTREVCILFFVFLKAADAWHQDSEVTSQSRVIELIHAVSGYSMDGIKSKVSKVNFLNEDKQYEKSVLKVKQLLNDLNSSTISKIIRKERL